jgi:3-hydroxyisobutyrate dehydrogenase
MGQRMTRNLAAAGFQLVVYDIDRERRTRVAADLGATPANAPADFATVDALITMVPTGAEVRNALLEWEGGIAAALAPGTVVVDMSSSSPVGTRELGPILAERGLPLVDAPVSGGTVGAEAGTLAVMIGADDDAAVERVRPALAAIGKSLVRVGGLGCGHAVKALNNYVAAAAFTATAEALLIGVRFGLEPRVVIDALNASDGRSVATERIFGPAVLSRTFDDGFALPLMAKDVRIAEELRAAVGIDAPTCELMNRLWQDALAAEGAQSDYTAAVRHWERRNGMQLPQD